MPFISSGTAFSLGSVRMCRHLEGYGGAEDNEGSPWTGTPVTYKGSLSPCFFLLHLEARKSMRAGCFEVPAVSQAPSMHSLEFLQGVFLSHFTANKTETQRCEVTGLRSHSL